MVGERQKRQLGLWANEPLTPRAQVGHLVGHGYDGETAAATVRAGWAGDGDPRGLAQGQGRIGTGRS
jgi:hypothetical protein